MNVNRRFKQSALRGYFNGSLVSHYGTASSYGLIRRNVAVLFQEIGSGNIRFIVRSNQCGVDASKEGWKLYLYVHLPRADQAAVDELDSATGRWQDGKGSGQATAAWPLIVIIAIKRPIT